MRRVVVLPIRERRAPLSLRGAKRRSKLGDRAHPAGARFVASLLAIDREREDKVTPGGCSRGDRSGARACEPPCSGHSHAPSTSTPFSRNIPTWSSALSFGA